MTAVNKVALTVFPVILLLISASAQDSLSIAKEDTVTIDQEIHQKRLRTLVIGSSVGYGISMVGLYHLWYADAGRQSFRFFDDNAEWKQLDKAGHFFSSFYLSYGAQRALLWTGMPKKKADLIAASTGFLMLIPVEILDGFSDAYGASTGDLIANALGPAVFFGQQALWGEIRVYPKYSFHTTRFAAMRPEMLGENTISQIIKDYNGQTQWLSVDLDRFVKFPRWLNIAGGYGAENMIYARDEQNFGQNLQPFRQYYLALDLDLTAIRTKSKTLKTLLFLANMVKIPAPTISFSRKGTNFHAFYF
jgi:hypothetical protein